jgi:hypothetical protein
LTTQWLAIQSFQQSQDLLDALNTLSIHLKLKLAGIPDQQRTEAATRARETLVSFLESFEHILNVSEQTKGSAILGIDPRLRDLARSFSSAKSDRQRFHSVLFTKTVSEVVRLLKATGAEGEGEPLAAYCKTLIDSLGELRALIEEHIHKDTVQILGEI